MVVVVVVVVDVAAGVQRVQRVPRKRTVHLGIVTHGTLVALAATTRTHMVDARRSVRRCLQQQHGAS